MAAAHSVERFRAGEYARSARPIHQPARRGIYMAKLLMLRSSGRPGCSTADPAELSCCAKTIGWWSRRAGARRSQARQCGAQPSRWCANGSSATSASRPGWKTPPRAPARSGASSGRWPPGSPPPPVIAEPDRLLDTPRRHRCWARDGRRHRRARSAPQQRWSGRGGGRFVALLTALLWRAIGYMIALIARQS